MAKWCMGLAFGLGMTFAAILAYAAESSTVSSATSEVVFDFEEVNDELVEEVVDNRDANYIWKNTAISSSDDSAKLPSGFQTNKTKKNSVLLISTLDGILTALNADGNGDVLWKLDTGPGTLLSSSISKVELSSNGQLFRLIPSLNGRLYKFDGEDIEPVPITADSLLHSSFRVSDDLLITGGKESQIFGLDAQTGRLQYICSASGCHTEPVSASSNGDFLIVKRHTHVVRAVEPRTGIERWNFSVGQHEAAILVTNPENLAECQRSSIDTEDIEMECVLRNMNKLDDQIDTTERRSETTGMEFKVVVPDGLVYATNSKDSGSFVWRYKFDSPVVHAWHITDGRLIPLDLFTGDSIPALENKTPPMETTDIDTSPLLYVGIHNKQLYIQESNQMARLLSENVNPFITSAGSKTSSAVAVYKFPWKPLPATSLIAVEGRPGRFTISSTTKSSVEDDTIAAKMTKVDDDLRQSALIVRYEVNYPFDRGFYIVAPAGPAPKQISEDKDETENATNEEEEWWEGGKDTTVHILVVSLWFWWREVVFISVFTAFISHFIVTRQVVHFLRRQNAVELQRRVTQSVTALIPVVTRAVTRAVLLEQERAKQDSSPDIAGDGNANVQLQIEMEPVVVSNPIINAPAEPILELQFISRYLEDFEPIQCLGRGGFGLVFEARNRLDDCHYAVKRIRLPNNQEAREKVMREVKALAKLDNPHIVRYFHSWIECPPPGWQEKQDAQWFDCENCTGPTPFNTGEDESASQIPSWSKNEADVSKIFNRSFEQSFGELKRRSSSSDSSFDVVFEEPSNPVERVIQSDKSNETSFVNSTSQRSGASRKRNRIFDIQSNHSTAKSFDDSSENSSSIDFSVPSHSPVQSKAAKATADRPVSEAKMYLYIQMQLCRKESLREWLRAHVAHRDYFHVLHMFNEIVRAVEYVHLQGLMHRDLKPSNIFFAPDGAIKIGDFGLVTAMSEEAYAHSPADVNSQLMPFHKHTDQVGTQLYMSPEQIEGKPYNHKVDIYSLGLIFFELLWPLTTQMEQINVISQLRKLRFPQGFLDKYPEEYKLLQKMLSRNPDERPTTYGIRASPPLINHQDPSIFDIPEYLYYNLQRVRSTNRTSSSSSS